VTDEPPDYVAEHVHEAMAHDPRLNELGIRVTISGEKAFLTGDVATEARKDAAGDVATEALPGYEVHNHVAVVDCSRSGGEEIVA
jgi:osmotically-inducible protein OsmY